MLKLIHLSIIAHLLHLIASIADHDIGIEKACTFMGGAFTKRSQPSTASPVGDTCHFTFHNQWTQDQEQSDEFCDLYAPWRLIKSVPGEKTECLVEATFVCDPGWMQMFGMCFQMPQAFQRTNRQKAEEVCAKSRSGGAKIAFMHRKYIVGVWERFYRGVEQIWVRASEAWKKYEVKVEHRNEGDALALAFTGDSYDFNVHSYSLIRVSKDVDLQVLCEYEPVMTVAEVNYLGRRYSEIYWPSIPVENGILVRSGTHYAGRQDSSNLEVCKNVLKPFKANDLEQFMPTDEYLKRLSEHSPMISYSHALGYQWEFANSNQPMCLAMDADEYRIVVDANKTPLENPELKFSYPNQPNVTCDNMASGSIVHTTSSAHLRSMPFSLSAPMWCKAGRVKEYKAVTEPGWHAFRRPLSGMYWAHYIVNTTALKWDDAQEYCKNMGARLTGIESYAEAKFIHDILLSTTTVGESGLYIGGQRKKDCANHPNWDPNVLSPCSRANVIQWKENVANVPISDKLWTEGTQGRANPDFAGWYQNCLVLIGKNPGWLVPGDKGYFDDIGCDTDSWFICGKWVDMVEVTPN